MANIETLGSHIWDSWARPDGSIGPMYGHQLRKFNQEESAVRTSFGVDQLWWVIEGIKKDPMSRRHLMTTFNPLQVEHGVLWPCHGISIQFNCSPMYEVADRVWEEMKPIYYLDLHMHMRSNDLVLGGPTNITEYALLLMLVAREVNMIPRYYIHTAADIDRKSTRLNSSHVSESRMPSSA